MCGSMRVAAGARVALMDGSAVSDLKPLVLGGNSFATGTALVCKHITVRAAAANVPWLWLDG